MKWKGFVAGLLRFSRKDRLGVLTLLVLILLVYALPYLMPSRTEPPLVLDDSLQILMDALRPAQTAGYANESRHETDVDDGFAAREDDFSKGPLFAFDPNTIDADGWRKLGLRAKTIRTILNFRSKGGKFYKPQDLQKIWGLPPGFYERVEGYIRITKKESTFAERPAFSQKLELARKASQPLDINTADTSAWIALPGIGPKLAGRIVNFRNKLGGFTSVEQVGTTYGLPDSTFQKIKPLLRATGNVVSRININTATKEQLSAHPYINWKLANIIITFREQHGAYQDIEDLKKITVLDDTTFEKLKPYLRVQ